MTRPPGTGKRLRCALLGDPVASSLSPFLHREAARRRGLYLSYDLIHCSRQDLGSALEDLYGKGYDGVNLTHPLKEEALPHLAETGASAACGSVNWLERIEGGWRGHSSDGSGFCEALDDRRPRQMLIAGAGGVVRSILPELLRRLPECRPALRSRDAGKARRMLASLGLDLPVYGWEEEPPPADLLVNATPLGMAGEHELPFPLSSLEPRPLCFDLVSVPRWTPWLLAARRAGCETLPGREMLVAQAAPAFAAWTGAPFPREELRRLFAARQQLREGLAAGSLRGPLLLLGFMGAGKTTLGRALAALLDWPFLDLDEELARRSGRSPEQWLRDSGEAAFREQEAAVWSAIRRDHAAGGVVLAGGGGLPLAPGFFERARRQAYCIFLDAPAPLLLERLRGDGRRPLLEALDDAGIRTLLEQRRPVYEQAEFRLAVFKAPPEDLAGRILTTLAPVLEEAKH